jgi:hypothetical protein
MNSAATIGGNGQMALFLNQIRCFENLAGFQGMLRISTPSTGA